MTPEIVNKIIELIRDYGLVGALLVIIAILILNPDKAEKSKILFLNPLFRCFKVGAKQYIGTRISYYSSQFINNELKKYLPKIKDLKIKIRWVNSESEAILSSNSLILRLEETNDQTRNALAATKLALPKIICPTIRANIQPFANTAIDLALLRKFSEKLGQHSIPVFQKYFLYPDLEKHIHAGKLLAKLISIDDKGIFVSIFLDQLNTYGEYLYSKFITEDRTDEIISFLEFLLTIAVREIGQEVPLSHDSSELRVAILLLAITSKAEEEGVTPYIKRIQIYTKRGFENIYIIAYPAARKFLSKVLKALEAEDNIYIENHAKIEMKQDSTSHKSSFGEIAKLQVINLFNNTAIDAKLSEMSLKVGDRVNGLVLDTSIKYAVIDVNGINCFIDKKECSWMYIKSCADILETDQNYDFKILSIDKGNNRIYLTKRFDEEDPFKPDSLPKIDDEIEVRIKARSGNNLIGYYNQIEILIPYNEIAWFPDQIDLDSLLETENLVKIYYISTEDKLIKGSIRLAKIDPWPEIHKKYPKGTELNVTVTGINDNHVKVKIEENVFGIIPRDSMIKAGFEYEEYLKNVVPGQGLQVVVSKVFIEKRKIRLDLRRNIKF